MSSTLTKSLVVSTNDMDREAFCLHMTHRHPDSLGDLDSLRPRHLSPEVEAMYRSFHRRLHSVRVDLEHEHEGYTA